jgi:hypothetical protein
VRLPNEVPPELPESAQGGELAFGQAATQEQLGGYEVALDVGLKVMEDALNDLVTSLAERDQVVLSVIICQAERNDVVNLKPAQGAATSAEWRPSQSLSPRCSPARAAACPAFCPAEVSLIATARTEVARGVVFPLSTLRATRKLDPHVLQRRSTEVAARRQDCEQYR